MTNQVRSRIKAAIWAAMDWTKSNSQIAAETGKAYDTVARRRVALGKSGMALQRSPRKDLQQRIAWLQSPEMREKSKQIQPLATQAAKASPKAGRGIDNVHAEDWHLLSPTGDSYKFRNLYEFVRAHTHLFSPDDVAWKRQGGGRGTGGEYCNATAGILNIKGGKAKTWKGWKLICADSAKKDGKASNRGGARPNSGRKPSSIERKPTTVWISQQEREKLKKLGGSKWLQKTLAAQS